MKKTLRMLLLVLVLCVGLVMPAAAETTDGFASDHICMVDMAGVLNEQEVTELEMMIDEIRTRQKFDIAILIVSEEDIPSMEEYADDIYDGADMGYGQTRDGVLLVVDLKSSECYMSTKGYGITVFTDAGIQYVGQQMRPELADGDYAGAFRTFATLCDDFITQARNGKPYDADTLPKEPLSLIWIPVAIVIGFIIAFVIVGGMKKQLKTVRFQAKADDYVKAGSMNLVYDLLDLGLLPDLAGHFAVQGPDDLLNTGDLLNVAQGDGVIALTIPAPTHFHRHVVLLLFV